MLDYTCGQKSTVLNLLADFVNSFLLENNDNKPSKIFCFFYISIYVVKSFSNVLFFVNK